MVGRTSWKERRGTCPRGSTLVCVECPMMTLMEVAMVVAMVVSRRPWGRKSEESRSVSSVCLGR